MLQGNAKHLKSNPNMNPNSIIVIKVVAGKLREIQTVTPHPSSTASENHLIFSTVVRIQVEFPLYFG